MPNKSAAKKALRQAKKHALLNKIRRDAFRGAIKSAAKAKTFEEALAFARTAQKALDKAAKRHTIKKKTAARKLSRLMSKVNKLKK